MWSKYNYGDASIQWALDKHGDLFQDLPGIPISADIRSTESSQRTSEHDQQNLSEESMRHFQDAFRGPSDVGSAPEGWVKSAGAKPADDKGQLYLSTFQLRAFYTIASTQNICCKALQDILGWIPGTGSRKVGLERRNMEWQHFFTYFSMSLQYVH